MVDHGEASRRAGRPGGTATRGRAESHSPHTKRRSTVAFMCRYRPAPRHRGFARRVFRQPRARIAAAAVAARGCPYSTLFHTSHTVHSPLLGRIDAWHTTRMDTEQPDGQEWVVGRLDPLSGELLGDEELAFRARIRAEAEQGMVGVDALYLSAKGAIHQPLVGEQGSLSGDSWLLTRANKTTLRVPVPEAGDSAALARAAVTIAGAAIDEFAAEVMLHLFAMANDPPNWRRPDFSVRLSDLLDRLGFKRDNRGVHRSDARRRLTSTLLALHLTHVGLQRSGPRRAGGRAATGFIAPLLSAVGYATQEDVGHLSPIEVFEQGLPEQVAVVINSVWYEGVRRRDGLPGAEYALIPHLAPPEGAGRAHRGRRSPVVDLLREYLLRCRAATESPRITVSRQALLDVANIHDRNPRQAGRTLGRALDALHAGGQVRAYSPRPLPMGPADLIVVDLGPA